MSEPAGLRRGLGHVTRPLYHSTRLQDVGAVRGRRTRGAGMCRQTAVRKVEADALPVFAALETVK